MIATLKGIIQDKLTDSVVLEVNGVGYGLLVPLDTHESVAIGDECQLYVYEHIRENVYDLYGFLDTSTKSLFELLINVNGVGPKVGLSILSIGSASNLKQAIAGGNVAYIQSASGVGKRVAERVVIDLKDKVGLVSSADGQALLTGDAVLLEDEAVQALVALGYTVQDAAKSLKDVGKSLTTKERVTIALRNK
jgi:Holliday junction DNA helicase RuvA